MRAHNERAFRSITMLIATNSNYNGSSSSSSSNGSSGGGGSSSSFLTAYRQTAGHSAP